MLLQGFSNGKNIAATAGVAQKYYLFKITFASQIHRECCFFAVNGLFQLCQLLLHYLNGALISVGSPSSKE